MPNFMERAQTWLAGKLTTHASVTVIYTRDRGRKTVTFNAIPSRPRAQGLMPGTIGRVRLDDERVEFHFQPALLDFGNGPVEPERGDRLTIGTVIREVAPDGNQPFTRRSDVAGNLIAVHTKLE